MQANVKTIVLANKRAVRPETWQKIADATDGEVVWVEPTEMNAFVCLNIFLPSDAPLPPPKREPKKAPTKEGTGNAGSGPLPT